MMLSGFPVARFLLVCLSIANDSFGQAGHYWRSGHEMTPSYLRPQQSHYQSPVPRKYSYGAYPSSDPPPRRLDMHFQIPFNHYPVSENPHWYSDGRLNKPKSELHAATGGEPKSYHKVFEKDAPNYHISLAVPESHCLQKKGSCKPRTFNMYDYGLRPLESKGVQNWPVMNRNPSYEKPKDMSDSFHDFGYQPENTVSQSFHTFPGQHYLHQDKKPQQQRFLQQLFHPAPENRWGHHHSPDYKAHAPQKPEHVQFDWQRQSLPKDAVSEVLKHVSGYIHPDKKPQQRFLPQLFHHAPENRWGHHHSPDYKAHAPQKPEHVQFDWQRQGSPKDAVSEVLKHVSGYLDQDQNMYQKNVLPQLHSVPENRWGHHHSPGYNVLAPKKPERVHFDWQKQGLPKDVVSEVLKHVSRHLHQDQNGYQKNVLPQLFHHALENRWGHHHSPGYKAHAPQKPEHVQFDWQRQSLPKDAVSEVLKHVSGYLHQDKKPQQRFLPQLFHHAPEKPEHDQIFFNGELSK